MIRGRKTLLVGLAVIVLVRHEGSGEKTPKEANEGKQGPGPRE